MQNAVEYESDVRVCLEGVDYYLQFVYKSISASQ